jgi:hypothetical protein
VVKTEPPHHTPFARALCQPLGGVGRYRHMAVLVPIAPSAEVEKQQVEKQLQPASKKNSK